MRDHGAPLPGDDGVLGCRPPPADLVLSTLLPSRPVHIAPSILRIISLVIAVLLDPDLPYLGHGQTADQAVLLRSHCSLLIGPLPMVWRGNLLYLKFQVCV